MRPDRAKEMAEEKKAKKPRSVKKTGAGTGSQAEKQVKEVPIVTVEAEGEKGTPKAKRAPKTKKTVSPEMPVEEIVAAGETAVEESVKKAKKAPVKKAAKKKEAAAEAPVETAVEAAAEAPVETVAKEVAPTAVETVVETVAEAVVETVEAAEKAAPKKRAKKSTAKKETPAVNEGTETKAVVKEENAVGVETPAEAVAKETPAPAPVVEPAKKAATKKATAAEKKDGVKEEKVLTLTRAEKKDAIKKIVREVLQTERKWSELIDLAAQAYQAAYPIPENGNVNDVRGRVGSVLHLMQEEKEIVVDGNFVRLSSQETAVKEAGGEGTVLAEAPMEAPMEAPAEAPASKKQPKTKKEATVSALNEAATVENSPVKLEDDLSKNGEKAVEAPTQTALVATAVATPAPVYDMSSLFGERRVGKKSAPVKEAVEAAVQEKKEEIAKTKPVKTEEKPVAAVKAPEKKVEEKPATTEKKPVERKPAEKQARREIPTRRMVRSGKADPLKDEFLKRLRSLGGNYFEYYAIYLLERYSRMNGRRLEGLRISGGERDGGIDGELELTDRLGFRETIYVQAKNWEPTDERWYIGETILQQFIGAVAYRQAVEGKQHCRGMFITTSTFTTGAKEMLEKMSDRFVGYDGDELFDTAKECEFGLVKDGKGGWKIDEELLSGKKSFFFML